MSDLYQALLKLKTPAEVATFWRDLLTLKEIKTIVVLDKYIRLI